LYASSRLYINFFQPSFKLKSKTRDGARVHKVYLAPATPCDRLLAHDSVEPAIKEKLKAQFNSLDPVRLLQEMRTAQQTLSDFAAHGVRAEAAPAAESDVAVFLASLSSAWKEGEARPTHRKQPKAKQLVEKSGGSVRRCVAANRRMVDCRALCAGQRIDGSVGRDVSRSVRKVRHNYERCSAGSRRGEQSA